MIDIKPVLSLIKKYKASYPDDKIYIHGGYAAYLHIKKKLGIEVPIHDIDIQVETIVTVPQFQERLRTLLPKGSLSDVLDKWDSILTVKIGDISTDWFYRRYDMAQKTVVIDGIHVPPLSVVYKDETFSTEELTGEVTFLEEEGVDCCLQNEDGPISEKRVEEIHEWVRSEIEWRRDKLDRKRKRLDHIRNAIAM